MKRQTVTASLVFVLVLSLAALACGGSQSGSKVDTQGNSPTNTPGVTSYAVGDVIEVKGQTIVLNEYSIDGTGRLKANFTVENKGSEDFTMSGMMQFTAKNDDGEKLELDIFDCDPDLGGTVLPGDKLKGNLCWDGMTTDKGRIYYEASMFGSGAIVWDVAK